MEREQDWTALAADWRAQETPSIDLDAIRAEAERRGRGLRWIIGIEIALTALVVLACVMIALNPRSDRIEVMLFSGMAVALVAYQGLMVWIRRRDLADVGRDALSLVERELQRATTVLRYWRWGMWSGLALWLCIYVLLLFGLSSDWPASLMAGLLGATAANVLVFPAVGLYGWWRCNQARRRLVRFGALREQLRAP
jgi:hypothetical protein